MQPIYPVNTARRPYVFYDTCYERVGPDVSPTSFMTRPMNVFDPTCRRRRVEHVLRTCLTRRVADVGFNMCYERVWPDMSPTTGRTRVMKMSDPASCSKIRVTNASDPALLTKVDPVTSPVHVLWDLGVWDTWFTVGESLVNLPCIGQFVPSMSVWNCTCANYSRPGLLFASYTV